jgi:hypothetical protein
LLAHGVWKSEGSIFQREEGESRPPPGRVVDPFEKVGRRLIRSYRQSNHARENEPDADELGCRSRFVEENHAADHRSGCADPCPHGIGRSDGYSILPLRREDQCSRLMQQWCRRCNNLEPLH